MPYDQAGAEEDQALEAGELSAWVAGRRAAALDQAKARDEEALESWVADARVVQPRRSAPKPPKRRPLERAAAGKQQPGAKPPRTPARHSAPPPPVPKAALPVDPVAPEPAVVAESAVVAEPAVRAEPVVVAEPLRAPKRPAFTLALRRLRLALSWYAAKLVQQVRPERVPLLASKLVRSGRSVVLALARFVLQLLWLPPRLAATCEGTAVRFTSRSARWLCGFVAQLDLAGRIALPFAVAGIVLAALLLART
jgi:hypothetical protein